MILFDSRRRALSGILVAISGSWKGLLSTPSSQSKFDIESCADLICKWTPDSLRNAVQKTSCFLYRGSDAPPSSSICKIENPEPDLLLSGTYDDKDALNYFFCLERRLGSFPARPSTGHIATSDPEEAGKWGNTVSAWPLGTNLAFLWPEDSQVIVSGKEDCKQSKLVLNSQLSEALKQNREVLFSSWFEEERTPNDISTSTLSTESSFLSLKSAFLTVPSNHDEELRRALERRNYGLSEPL